MRFLLPVLLLLSSSELLAENSAALTLPDVLKFVEERHLGEERQWRKLLHFEKDFFQVQESQIDSASFFFSKVGKKNPHEELKATITAFFSPATGDVNEHAQCRFPARFQWLKKHLNNQNVNWPVLKCDRFLAFSNGITGNSVSLVFSSYYLNNPSSAFGHTFLRINKDVSKDGKRHELLDYGLNYAAEADTNNAFLYGFKGLFGMFPGQFRSIPYYYKVREYNNAESRDLWEYDLKIGPAAVSMLIAHIWELGPAQIDYWYLTENCSYHMLSILEAADPNVDILSKLDQYIIPADTVRVLWNKTDLVTGYKYRPSVREVFFKRWESLSATEKDFVYELAQQIKKQDEITYSADLLKSSQESQARVLDTYIDFIDFRYSKEVQEASREMQLKLRVLGKRSEIDVAPEKIVIDPIPELRPHLAHPSGRWGIGGRLRTDDTEAVLLSHRFALHDRLDPAWGYPSTSQITFFDLDFSYGKNYLQENKFEIENFSAFELVSASPWSRLIPDRSWRFKLGVERTRNENFLPTHEGIIRLGYGWTFAKGNWDLSAHLMGEAHYGPHLPKNYLWAGVGPLVELHYQINSMWALEAQAFYRRDSGWEAADYLRTQVQMQYSVSKEWGLRVGYRNERFIEETNLTLFHYY